MSEVLSDTFRLTLAQLDPTVGDLAANAAQARAAWAAGRDAGADLVATPEMFLCGYQAQDLVMRPSFVRDCRAALEALARDVAEGPALMIGLPMADEAGLSNAMALLEKGRVRAVFRKATLPNDGVFDEHRYFEPGPAPGPISVHGLRIGVPICEDAWFPDVAETLQESGAEFLLIPNGSPYARDKLDAVRLPLMVARTVETGLPLVYLNLVGAQEDQVFDGGSFALNPGGALAWRAPQFETGLHHLELSRGAEGWRVTPSERALPHETLEADYRAMVEATRAYFRKTGFKTALLGLSGGIDSALVATIAADALGSENVRCVMLPSQYTSRDSLEDAAGVADALGCRLDELAISEPVAAAERALRPFFQGMAADLTEENIQSRMRGLLLMAMSNKTGALLLTTGNKSEVAVGYATLYGDMCGAYNPIKDLYKMRVFETCRWRNANHRAWMMGPAGGVVPQRVIDKPPSAELRADQKDEDSLPPYERLDAILERLVDKEESVAEIVAAGFDPEEVRRIQHLVFISEYKRRQSAPGPKLTDKAFWLDRRYPIVNRWRDSL